MGTEAYDENTIRRIAASYGLNNLSTYQLERIMRGKKLGNPKYLDQMADLLFNLQKIGEPPKKNPIKNTCRGAGRTGKIGTPSRRKPLLEDF